MLAQLNLWCGMSFRPTIGPGSLYHKGRAEIFCQLRMTKFQKKKKVLRSSLVRKNAHKEVTAKTANI